jgi:hypothetical protein
MSPTVKVREIGMSSAIRFFGCMFMLLMAIGVMNNRSHDEVITAETWQASPEPGVTNDFCAVTAQGYARLQSGDTYATAVAELGCNGIEISRSDIPNYITVIYMWEGRPLGANMSATFQNDKLTGKAQLGF